MGFKVRENQADPFSDQHLILILYLFSPLNPHHGLQPSTVQEEDFSTALSTPPSPTPLSVTTR